MNVSSYQLNHPKAYLGYTLAFGLGSTKDRADELCEEYVTGGTGMARRGAQNLRLITESTLSDREWTLTSHGRELFDHAPHMFGCDTVRDVLEEFDSIRGARSRFCEQYPEFTNVAPTVAQQDVTVGYLIGQLQGLHRQRVDEDKPYAIGTDELYQETVVANPEFTEALFKHNGQWRSSTTYTLKNVLWHLGVLQAKGKQANEIDDPDELTWALEPAVLNHSYSTIEAEVEASG